MGMPKHRAATAVYLFMWRDGEVLITRRVNTGYQDGNYQVPAGHIEEGELPIQAIIREAKEEVGVTLLPGYLSFAHVVFRAGVDETGDRIDIFYATHRWQGEIVNAEPHKCDDIRWVTLDQLPENMTPHVRLALLESVRGERYSQLSLEYLRSTGMYMMQ